MADAARSVVIDRATTPVWSSSGHLLFARAGAVMAISFDPAAVAVRSQTLPVMPSGQTEFVAVPFAGAGSQPVIGKPVALFPDIYDYGAGISIPNYDVTPDGRFVLTRRDAGDGGLKLGVNWTNELQRILASGGVR